MTAFAIGRPSPNEYSEYHQLYISKVPDGQIMTILRDQLDEAITLFKTIPESKGDYRYEPGKWTLKEVIGHLSDGERIMAYRALRFARNDQTPLPGFEQDDYIPYSNSNECSLADLINEFATLRESTLTMFKNFSNDSWERVGTASGNRVSVRGMAYIIAGHLEHHLRIIREKYLA